MGSDDRSFGARFIAERPDVREQVVSSPEFQAWRGGLATVVVDGLEYFVIGGDMLLGLGDQAL